MKFVQVQMVALGAHYVPTIKLSLRTCTVSLEQIKFQQVGLRPIVDLLIGVHQADLLYFLADV